MQKHPLHLSTLEQRDTEKDLASMERRLEQFRELEPLAKSRDIGASSDTPFSTPQGLPEIAASELTADKLRHAVKVHGALLVRDLLPEANVRQALRDMVDQVIEATNPTTLKAEGHQRSTWYNPPPGLSSFTSPRNMSVIRKFLADVGGALCIESPAVAEALFTLYDSLGLRELLTQYFEETPCVSVKKWVLRRTELPISEGGWHQDGAFMGTDIKSLNLWLPLTHCGANEDAPGLDIVHGRQKKIVAADGAAFKWASGPDLVKNELGDNAYLCPEFNSGDALFFDHFNLHRSQFREHFSKPRHAIETWFFGSESFPKNQIPIAW